MRISIRPVASLEPIVRALGWFVLVASTLFILFAGLFPFDFYVPHHGLWNQIVRKFDSSPEPALLSDKIDNLAFFMPFGFGLATTIRARGKTKRIVLQIVAAMLLGVALSLIVEVSQVFLGFRDPTWLDVLMNTLGAVCGASIVAFGGDALLESIARPLGRLRPHVTFATATTALVLYTLVQLALPLLTRDRGTLENWDNGFPLVVGNEASGDRAWNGRVWQIDLASRAADQAQVTRIFADGTARHVLGDAVVGSYTTEGAGPYPDQAGLLKPLTWTSPAPEESQAPPTSQPAQVNGGRWLQTQVAVAPAVHRIRQTSQFTLVATIAPDEPFQDGPARIVSISGGVPVRNVSLMHLRHDLSLRVRTLLLGRDGSAPEALVDDVFSIPDKKQIVLSYNDPLLMVYVNGVVHGRMEITPEAALIWRMYPRVGFKLKLSRYGFGWYALIYRLLVFVPFAALLAVVAALSGKNVRTQLLITALSILVTAIALEIILGSLTSSGFQARNLLVSVLAAALSVAALRLRRKRRALETVYLR